MFVSPFSSNWTDYNQSVEPPIEHRSSHATRVVELRQARPRTPFNLCLSNCALVRSIWTLSFSESHIRRQKSSRPDTSHSFSNLPRSLLASVFSAFLACLPSVSHLPPLFGGGSSVVANDPLPTISSLVLPLPLRHFDTLQTSFSLLRSFAPSLLRSPSPPQSPNITLDSSNCTKKALQFRVRSNSNLNVHHLHSNIFFCFSFILLQFRILFCLPVSDDSLSHIPPSLPVCNYFCFHATVFICHRMLLLPLSLSFSLALSATSVDQQNSAVTLNCSSNPTLARHQTSTPFCRPSSSNQIAS
jgi:hypothetical protein